MESEGYPVSFGPPAGREPRPGPCPCKSWLASVLSGVKVHGPQVEEQVIISPPAPPDVFQEWDRLRQIETACVGIVGVDGVQAHGVIRRPVEILPKTFP